MIWISRDDALERLGVKPQTLYAYASRGLVRARPSDTDPRASVYAIADIDALLKRRRAGRRRTDIAASAIAWGDPMMPTAITTVREGRLIYRGEDAVTFSRSATLEDAARLLWDAAPVARRTSTTRPPSRSSAKARGLSYLADRAATDPPAFGRSRTALAEQAMELLVGLGAAMAGGAGQAPFHRRLAAYWSVGAVGEEVLRRALVLVADHELNPSTFSARVAASTGGSLAAAALAGFATLTGPLHGEASARALAYLERALAVGPKAALAEIAAQGARIPAVGHTLYPDGDPRAAALLSSLRMKSALRNAIAAAEGAAGEAANIDMALAAMTLSLDLPAEAPFVVFAGGRMAGWMAHAMEQVESRQPIRPRATYVGR